MEHRIERFLPLLNKFIIMRTKIVAGNWKMNKTVQEGLELVDALQTELKKQTPKCRVIVAPPFLHLVPMVERIDQTIIGLGAQNCADHTSGAYTGEIAPSMLSASGVSYVIIGHSERRLYYHETGSILATKVDLVLAENLTPIFCVGEQFEDRKSNKYFQIIEKQLEEALFHLSPADFSKIILAYEPVWAIGTGCTASPEQAQEMHAHIRQFVAKKYGQEVADNCSILYGGSCKASNAKELFANPDVDGGLIGGAALAVDSFLPIIQAFNK